MTMKKCLRLKMRMLTSSSTLHSENSTSSSTKWIDSICSNHFKLFNVINHVDWVWLPKECNINNLKIFSNTTQWVWHFMPWNMLMQHSQGYFDDTVNTDNAWVEVHVSNVHIDGSFSTTPPSVRSYYLLSSYRLCLYEIHHQK